MTAFVTSVLPAQEVIKLMLEKYKVESEPSQFALYAVKETGGESKRGDGFHSLYCNNDEMT